MINSWTRLLAICVLTPCCFGSAPAPFAAEMEIVDRVIAATRSPRTAEEALRVLIVIAEGRPEMGSGLAPNSLGFAVDWANPDLKNLSVRGYAMRGIGDVDLSEALAYLSARKRSDFSLSESGALWPAVCIGLYTSRLNRIPEADKKLDFLEHSLKDGGIAAWWAANELCDLGSAKSLPLVLNALKEGLSGQAGDREFRFCEARVHVLSRDANRIIAFGSVFSVEEDGNRDLDLSIWAARQLLAMRNPEADRIVERYCARVESLAGASAGRANADRLVMTIRGFQAKRNRHLR